MDTETLAQRYADLETLSRELAGRIVAILGAAIAARGLASLVVSGGRSPLRLFEILRSEPLDWSRVCIALADERWVLPTDAASNEHLVRSALHVFATDVGAHLEGRPCPHWNQPSQLRFPDAARAA